MNNEYWDLYREAEIVFKDLRKLFGPLQPSVSRFRERLKELPPEEKERYYRQAYFVAMNHWGALPVWYKTFLVNLVKNDWQRFLDYVRETSVLGHMPFLLKDKKLVWKVFGILARLPMKDEGHASFNHIAFVLSLGFCSKEKISYLSKQIRSGKMTPEELQDFRGKAIIDC